MARGKHVQVRGLKQLQKRADRLVKEVRDAGEAAVTEEAEEVRDEMVRNVPVDQGDLRDSIRADVDTRTFTAEIGPRGRDQYYGYFQEFGTKNMRAKPFAGPAGEVARRSFPGRLKRHLRKALPK